MIRRDVEFTEKGNQTAFRDYKRDGTFCRVYEFEIPQDEPREVTAKILKSLEALPELTAEQYESFSPSRCRISSHTPRLQYYNTTILSYSLTFRTPPSP
jgi:hypothetical protein